MNVIPRALPVLLLCWLVATAAEAQVGATPAIQKYLDRAAAGHAPSQAYVAYLYYSGRQGLARDLNAAAYWFGEAAKQGVPEAQYNLAAMHYSGEGVANSEAEAVRWFQAAAEQGHARAQFQMGSIMQQGYLGSAPDARQAAYWYEQAGTQGHAEAQYRLGNLQRQGAGIPRDAERARYWLGLAAAQGHAEAQQALEDLRSEPLVATTPPPATAPLTPPLTSAAGGTVDIGVTTTTGAIPPTPPSATAPPTPAPSTATGGTTDAGAGATAGAVPPTPPPATAPPIPAPSTTAGGTTNAGAGATAGAVPPTPPLAAGTGDSMERTAGPGPATVPTPPLTEEDLSWIDPPPVTGAGGAGLTATDISPLPDVADATGAMQRQDQKTLARWSQPAVAAADDRGGMQSTDTVAGLPADAATPPPGREPIWVEPGPLTDESAPALPAQVSMGNDGAPPPGWSAPAAGGASPPPADTLPGIPPAATAQPGDVIATDTDVGVAWAAPPPAGVDVAITADAAAGAPAEAALRPGDLLTNRQAGSTGTAWIDPPPSGAGAIDAGVLPSGESTLGLLQPPPAQATAPGGMTWQVGGFSAAFTLDPTLEPIAADFQRDNQAGALERLQPLAIQGMPAAQLMLGASYYLGRGVARDRGIAFHWFRRAAEQSLPEAQYLLGHLHYSGDGVTADVAQARRWYEMAAAQDWLPALRLLSHWGQLDAELLRDETLLSANRILGAAGPDDTQQGRSLRRVLGTNETLTPPPSSSPAPAQQVTAPPPAVRPGAAPQSLPPPVEIVDTTATAALAPPAQPPNRVDPWSAQLDKARVDYETALLYELGSGVERDPALAFEWYLKSAQQGYAPAQHKVAVAYTYGSGVAADSAEAARWFERAALQGYAMAQRQLGMLYLTTDRPDERIKAYAWFRVASRAGDPMDERTLQQLQQQMPPQDLQAGERMAGDLLRSIDRLGY